MVGKFVEHYNNERLHGSIGYLAPAAVLEGRPDAIRAERQLNLRAARLRRERDSPLTGKEANPTLLPIGPARIPAEAVALTP